jgi:hypothetical protein
MGRSSVVSRAWLGLLGAMFCAGTSSCYSTGDGTAPPGKALYFPVGLQVSAGGTVLYAVNSDFDLQFNGGTLQSYDLALIRQHTLDVIRDPRAPNVPILDRQNQSGAVCPGRADAMPTLGETCAPPVDSSFYVRDTAIIGAFATDLLLSSPPSKLVLQAAQAARASAGRGHTSASPLAGTSHSATPGCPDFGNRRFDRLFAPVRGNASLTWASIERDGPDSIAPLDPATPYGPFTIQCERDGNGRCGGSHSAGSNPDETGNSRHITMPGEPFGLAMSEDGESILITHQNETKTSLFSTGLRRTDADTGGSDGAPSPFLQFVLDGIPFGGMGIAAVPHDRDAFLTAPDAFPRAAFLQTGRAFPEVELIRRYSDEFSGTLPSTASDFTGSSLIRPFIDREAIFPIAISAGGTDSRGIVIDPTPRLACKAKVLAAGAGRSQAAVDLELQACGQKPARVFIANRSPASLLIGEVGAGTKASDTFDPDRFLLHSVIPLSAGPSRLDLAPVVERDGAYGLRVFAVCFDAATVFVYNPDTEQVENIIRVGLGPFAMAFDPFDMVDVASHAQVPFDPRTAGSGLRRYRFAYLASFTNSFVQVLDLDDAQVDRSTFERVVFTLGRPTTPKGS